MSKVKLSAPWETFIKEMKAMFECDPDIQLDYDQDDLEVTLKVGDPMKADALAKLLPAEKSFGNVTLKIAVVPANEEETKADLFLKAFYRNPVFSYIHHDDNADGFIADYVVFVKKVVQYFNDNLADVNGNTSTLYQNIAGRIFDDHEGVFFCTNTEEDSCDCDIYQLLDTLEA